MRNSMKVAKWEIKRNMKNKTFVIGLLITPIMIIGIMFIGSLFDGSDTEESETIQLFVADELGLSPILEETIDQSGFNWELQQTDITEDEVKDELEDVENTAFIFLNEEALTDGVIPIYTSEEIDPYFMSQVQVLANPMKMAQMSELQLSEEELALITTPITFIDAEQLEVEETPTDEKELSAEQEELLSRVVPGAFAGFIMLSIVFTGMAIFQSASQEKKDKIAEILLSSLTPEELMQGKIIGYFVLGIIQTVVSLAIVLPVVIWRFDISYLVEYLLTPQLLLFILIAIMGYLLFAAIFVGVGATMTDMSTAGNFQGFVMMLPFLPFLFISPVINDPSGLWAQVGTYIPFTSPGVLLLRLTMLEEWPWVEIIIALAILTFSIWLFMKLAGKIFKVGILMYGKNATPGEIWKWIRA